MGSTLTSSNCLLNPQFDLRSGSSLLDRFFASDLGDLGAKKWKKIGLLVVFPGGRQIARRFPKVFLGIHGFIADAEVEFTTICVKLRRSKNAERVTLESGSNAFFFHDDGQLQGNWSGDRSG